MAARGSGEPPNDPEAGQRRSVPMDASRKFCQPGFLWRRNAQCERRSQHLNTFPGELCTTHASARRFARFGEHLSAMPLSRILNDQLTPGTSTSSNFDLEPGQPPLQGPALPTCCAGSTARVMAPLAILREGNARRNVPESVIRVNSSLFVISDYTQDDTVDKVSVTVTRTPAKTFVPVWADDSPQTPLTV